MFNKLTEFCYKRDLKEAIGFYLAYLLLIVLLSALMGGIMGLIIGPEGNLFMVGMQTGRLVAAIGSPVLSFLVSKDKDVLGDFKYIILGIFSGILALFGGALLGVVPVAFLTTREKKMEDNTREEQQSESDKTSTESRPKDLGSKEDSVSNPSEGFNSKDRMDIDMEKLEGGLKNVGVSAIVLAVIIFVIFFVVVEKSM